MSIGIFVFKTFSSLSREEKSRWRCNIVESFEKLQKRCWDDSPYCWVRWRLVTKTFATKGISSCIPADSMNKIELRYSRDKVDSEVDSDPSESPWSLRFDWLRFLSSEADFFKVRSLEVDSLRLWPSVVDLFRSWLL